MSLCPYTWIRSLIPSSKNDGIAKQLRVTVLKKGEVVVDVALPARSAKWLIDVIPDDVIVKIKAEGIPIEAIQEDLAQRDVFVPQGIFQLKEPHREVLVWLE